MPWIYIVECSDHTLYVGSTWDLGRRIQQHNAGEASRYTRRRRPVVLRWAQEFEQVHEAYAMERRLHGWSGKKKRALIEGRLEDLPGLSRGRRGSAPDQDPSTSSGNDQVRRTD